MTLRLVILFDARSTSLLDGFLIPVGNVHQVAQEESGWIRFTLTTISVYPLICGDEAFGRGQSVVMQWSRLTT